MPARIPSARVSPSGSGSALVPLFVLLLTGGCDPVTTSAGTSLAEVEVVDPSVVRTVEYQPPSPRAGEPPEETSLLLEEVACLHTDPPECRVRDQIRAMVHNQGAAPLHILSYCSQRVERFALGVWNAMNSGTCIIAGHVPPPLEITPGESAQVEVPVRGLEPDRYRVNLDVRDHSGLLPERMRLSDPFDLEPFPDGYTPFACPTGNEADRATRLAEEQLANARQGAPVRGGIRHRLLLEHRIPGFGGIFLDPDPDTVVILTEEARAAGADTLVHRVLSPGVEIRTGRFSYSEMLGWRLVFAEYARRLPGTNSLGIHEVRNAVTIGAGSLLTRTRLECIASGIGMPEGMLHVEENY